MFNLISELQTTSSITRQLTEIRECFQFYDDIVNESVQALADKFKPWLEQKNITPEDLGFLIAGISLLVSDEGRSVLTRQDLINNGLQAALSRAEKIDNVDINSMIRKQIIHLGKVRTPKLASMITEAIRNQNFTQIRNFILKLSVYVDRIKSKEKYNQQAPHDIKNNRRTAPQIQTRPTNA